MIEHVECRNEMASCRLISGLSGEYSIRYWLNGRVVGNLENLKGVSRDERRKGTRIEHYHIYNRMCCPDLLSWKKRRDKMERKNKNNQHKTLRYSISWPGKWIFPKNRRNLETILLYVLSHCFCESFPNERDTLDKRSTDWGCRGEGNPSITWIWGLEIELGR